MHSRTRNAIAIGLVLLGVGAIVRLLPYLAPIRTADIAQDDRAITFRDRNRLLLGTLLTRDRNHTAVVPLDEISPHFIQAILAAEDADFYDRGPVDLPAIARASYQAIRHRRIVSGASTVTMQLARLLQPAPRTIPHKVREIWRSWQLAAGMTKDEILTAYVNRLPMGGNIYGIEAAARIYFGTPAADLSLAQASLLAAIPNNPNGLNPYYHWDALLRRQTYTIERMLEEGLITRAEANRAYTETLSLQDRQHGIVAAPHFLFWAAAQLPAKHGTEVVTTLDRPLQQFVETQVREVVRALADRNVRQAAAIAIDNRTGEILAYVGSPNYFAGQDAAQFDGVQALRQPGSTLKPFLYQLAFENRTLRPNTVLADIPTYYALPDARIYRPVDFDRTFLGPVRVRLALANSLNVPAVRVLERLGVQAFLDRLQQLGFEHLNESAEHYGLGLSLGGGEASLWELARAYATLARQGEGIELRAIAAGDRSPGERGETRLGTANSWALVTDMLGDRYARSEAFGVDSVLNLSFPAAVKTGTSSNFRDTWTIGFSADYTVATWMGNFDGEPMQEVSGVDGAAPLWHRIMLHLHEDREPTALPEPENMVLRPICALSGLKPTDACPTVVQEYIFERDLDEYDRHLDSLYQLVDGEVRLQLPPEYDEWLALQGSTLLSDRELKILSPREGDRFVFYPDPAIAPEATQQLEFRLAEFAGGSVEWRLNDRLLPEPDSNSLFWELQPGVWTLEVASGELRDRVTFAVQSTPQRPFKPGFSLVESAP
ncbi:penicillin-binding protein 1C [Synechococcus sp. PCC 7336]|uniref:penicillin-binding protein 1C n=1 Tax=Synechococcus sp. PCC 7336 TaxID=195250 RepID=UPI000345CED7|nr:penicillin-binding protein 1C [Synechococcus sp. PCC 7336]